MLSTYKAPVREWYTRCVLIICGLIIAAPGIVGVVSSQAFTELYHTGALTDIEAVLLQHRAVMLTTIGILLILATAWKQLRMVAIIAAIVSNISFIGFVLAYPASGSSLGMIAWIDVALSALLITILFLEKNRVITSSTK